MNISYFDRFDFPNKSKTLQYADLCLTPMRVALCGRHFRNSQPNAQEDKIYSFAVRIFAGMCALLILPFTLTALTVKWLKRTEWQEIKIELSATNDEEVLKEDAEPMGLDPIVESDAPLSQDLFYQELQSDLACAHHLDKKLGSITKGTWRKFGQEELGEVNQTFEKYIKCKTYEDEAYGIKRQDWPDKCPLVIQLIGSFNEIEKKIVAITIDFLACFHQINIQLEETSITMDELKEDYMRLINEPSDTEQSKGRMGWYQHYGKKRMEEAFPRKNGQYDGSLALDLMNCTLKPKMEKKLGRKCNLIAFTSDDLFTRECSNFVFGLASLHGGVGIWSNSRFGDPKKNAATFESCLLRMMKISAHEFSHMRGLHHCTDYECNIGGYINIVELDNRPLINCLQDTAKICSLGQTSLLKYHQKLLQFFQKFNQQYELNCDFSKEIATLKERIIVMEKSKIGVTNP